MRKINTLAVVGSGTMGGGIAISAIAAGFPVVLIDTNKEMLQRAATRARKFLDRQVSKDRITQQDADTAFNTLQTSTTMDAAANVNLVIEAVFEDLATKQTVFQNLEAVVSDDCILATNTSALKVGDIADALNHPERLCGTHFFSPAEVNPVVEVVRAKVTAYDITETVQAFLRQCKKKPIACADQTGFALNRFFCPYTNEAARCLDDSLASPAQIDTVAMDAFGVPLGPFAVMNIVKPRINLAAIRSLEALGPFYAPAMAMADCGEADRLWEIEETPEALPQSTIQVIRDRLLGAVFTAVKQELSENVASGADIDLGAQMAFGFKEGPCAMMERLGTEDVDILIEDLARCGGATSDLRP